MQKIIFNSGTSGKILFQPNPRIRQRKMCCAGHLWLALLLLPWASVSPSAVQAQSSSDPLVFAFYYTWFDEATWTYDELSDLPVQPYVSRDRSVMGRHIDQQRRRALMHFWWPGTGRAAVIRPKRT